MIDAANEPGVHTIVYQIASQCGKSTVCQAIKGWTMHCRPSPILYVGTTEAATRDYLKERWLPLIEASPTLRTICNIDRRNPSLGGFTYDGGFFAAASSWRPADLAARSIKVAICDEIDRFPQSSGNEGSPIDLVRRRLTAFRNPLLVLASTPVSAINSRICEWESRGDGRRFLIPCHECGALHEPRLETLRWEPGKPATAHLVCPHCSASINERQRLAALQQGYWAATRDPQEPGIVSFQAGAFISDRVSLAKIATEAEAATDPAKRSVFTNTILGLPQADDETIAGVDSATLLEKGELVSEPYPAALQYVVAGIDIQQDRAEISFVGALAANGPNNATGQRVVLSHDKIMGDPTSPQLWLDLQAALERRFLTADRRNVPVHAAACDAGFATSAVTAFIIKARSKGLRIWPIFGRAGFGKPVWKQTARITKGGIFGFNIGVDDLKLRVMRQIALPKEAPSSIRFSDHLGETWLAEVVDSEVLVTEYKRGASRMKWEQRQRKRSEALDCLVYALAVDSVHGKDAPRYQQHGAPAPPTAPTIESLARQLNAHNTGT